jgi:hypothetical protein
VYTKHLSGKLKGRDALENVAVDRRIIFKRDLEEIEWWCWSDSSASG